MLMASTVFHLLIAWLLVLVPKSRWLLPPPATESVSVQLVSLPMEWAVPVSGKHGTEKPAPASPHSPDTSGITETRESPPLVPAAPMTPDRSTIDLSLSAPTRVRVAADLPSLRVDDVAATVRSVYRPGIWGTENRSLTGFTRIDPLRESAADRALHEWGRRLVDWVQERWQLPEGGFSPTAAAITVRLRIGREGMINGLSILSSSDSADWQEPILALLRIGERLPSLPSNYPAEEIVVDLNYSLAYDPH